ncbi:MAG: hypothetical protein ABSG84_05420 [Acidobacteriaceae bacterium]|jgi:hypothetical protein
MPSETTKRAVAEPAFKLVKWYMDCVSETGETAILYCADLRWRGIHASYSSVLLADGNAITNRSSMKRYRLDANLERIVVEFPQLSINGTWKATAAPPVQQTMYQDFRGTVLWNCLQPAAYAHISIGDRELNGVGYAECLTLTLPPWQLPLRRLRWGRFVSPQDSLAWIDWQGAYSTSLAVHNGRTSQPLSISDSTVALSDATLHIDELFPLRSGRLGSTILPGAPTLRKLLPHSLFDIDEKKWRSRGTLDTKDHQSHGWVIHEVVDWNC